MSILSRRMVRHITTNSTPTPPTTLPDWTNGSGGAFTDQTFVAYNGSKYHMYAAGRTNSTVDKPLGLVLQFHGDGAWEFFNPNDSYSLGGTNGIRAVSLAYNMICVPILSPNSDQTWWTTGNNNSDWVNNFVTNVIYPRYNIDRSRIWLSGYSGGAQFVAQFLVPKYSSLFLDGGAVISGGGGAPGTNSDASVINSFTSRFKQNYAMHWYTYQGDTGWDDDGYNAYADAQQGEAWYSNRGFLQTSHNYPPGGGHSSVTGKFGAELRARMQAKYGY